MKAMSWKMFFQILLLVVVSALILNIFKVALWRGKYKCWGDKDHPHHEKLHRNR